MPALALIVLITVFGGTGAVIQTVNDPKIATCAERVWAPEHVPLLISLDPSAADWAEDLDYVADWWNQQVPGSVFVIGTMPWEESQVGIHVRPLQRRNDGAQYAALTTNRMHDDCVIYRSDIALNIWVEPKYRREVLAHEIGHALGLPHAPPGSLMQESGGGAFVLPDETVELLRRRYPARH